MNTKQNPESDPLDTALSHWTVDTPLPARFQEQVWQRIATAETRTESGSRARLWRLLEDVLPSPKFALGYIGLALALGLGAGSLAAQLKTSRLEAELSLRYVQSVDPFRSASSTP